MEKSIFLLIVSLMLLDWLAEAWGLLPRQITWLPDILSILVFGYIFLLLPTVQRLPWGGAYTAVYLFVLLTAFGLLINQVSAPVAAAGIRNQLKYLPFFFFPFYFDLPDRLMARFLKLIFFFAFLQCPVSILQRLLIATTSGDVVGGTLGANTSGTLSLFCCFMTIFWAGYCYKFNVRSPWFLVGTFVLIIPMAINETKISFFLIPLCFLSIVFFIPGARARLRTYATIALCVLLFICVWKLAYNLYYSTGSDKRAERYMLKPEKILDYVYYQRFTKSGELNRIPQITFALDQIAQKPAQLLFGVGAGNASNSFFRSGIGKYYRKHKPYAIDRVFLGNMLWEYGLAGTALYYLMGVIFFVSIFPMRKLAGVQGALAIGFLGMSLVMLISTVYINTMRVDLFGYLYWFLSGYLLYNRYRAANLA